MIVARRFGSDVWSLELLLKYIHDELRACENCVAPKKIEREEKSELNLYRKGVYSASNLLSHGDTRNFACVFCNKNGHSSSQCRNVTNVKTRKDLIRKKGKCFVCLSSDHIARNCTVNYLCRKCQGKHNISICTAPENKKDSSDKGSGDKDNESLNVHVNSNGSILLQTAQAEVCNLEDDISIRTRMLFDSGSQRTYITQNIREKLCLETNRTERVIIKTFGKNEASVQNLDVVQFRVKNKFKNSFVFVEALCVPSICSPLTRQNISLAQNNYEHIRNLELADDDIQSSDFSIGILVGVDFYHNFITGKIIKANEGPVASESILGWVLSGQINSANENTSFQHCFETHLMRCVVEKKENSVQDELSKFWEIEDVSHPSECVTTQFEKDIKFDGERYITKLPFKPRHDILPDNYNVCEKRLSSLRKRLEQKEILYDYNNVFKDYLQNGIIEKVSSDEVTKDIGSVHYIPHRPIVREDRETTKIRAVFDASCSVNGPSLNQCLYSGPNLLAKIFDILLRFRFNKYVILADIKQAFLNVGINPEHKDFVRFLWYDVDCPDDVKLVIYRFLRVVFGITSSPFLLNGTIRYHLNKFDDNKFIDRFLEDLYVDDTISGCNANEEGMLFYDKALSIMAKGGFCLRKWVTNSPILQDYFDKREGSLRCPGNIDDLSYFESQMLSCKTTYLHVLGLEWDKNTDEFVFQFKEFLSRCKSMSITKRNILSVSASIYDPLGLISPITAQIKVIFQLLCKEKSEWDDNVSSEVLVIWNKFLVAIENLPIIRIPRFVFVEIQEVVESVELHGFCDSSCHVYSGVVYVRVVTNTGVKVSLLASKTKVAPLKTLSIPRLELLGSVILTKLLKDIKNALSTRVLINNVYCWTDSTVVLCWIKGEEKTWKPWVENRVVNVRSVVPRECWFHVSGVSNPADIPTRMIDNFENYFNGPWFKGPSFLSLPTIKKENENTKAFNLNEVLQEAKRNKFKEIDSMKVDVFSNSVLTNVIKELDVPTGSDKQTNTTDTTQICLSDFMDCERYNSLYKLIVVTGFVIRFVNNMIKRIRKDGEAVMNDSLTVKEYNNALILWIKDDQQKLKMLQKFPKLKSSLNLFEDCGILRLKGRFGNTNWTYDEKYPILLRCGSHFTKLIVMDAHHNVLHHGVDSTLSHIRRRFWINRGRKTVKDILRACITCKRFQGRTLLPPPSPDLPDFRVDHMISAFQATGLDFAGPLIVKRDDFSKNSFKAYILLLTCASSRAIHLELVSNMTVPGFLKGFRRFTARRGVPSLIVHDNFKTFHSTEVKKYMLKRGISQKFILPASPWWGGFYERLVRSVKTTLKKVLGKSFLTFEELQTVLCDIELIINTRPLTYTNEDDLEETLTPSHLIYGRDISIPQTLRCEPGYEDCSKRVQHVRTVLNHFWKRFRSVYLNQLRETHLYRKKKTGEKSVVIGDIVIIRDDMPVPRSDWRMGKVEEVIVGPDGYTRGAKLAVISKQGRRTLCFRPIQKLIPFEIVTENVNNEKPIPLDTAQVEIHDETHTKSNRPSRKAAKDGETLRKLRQKFYK